MQARSSLVSAAESLITLQTSRCNDQLCINGLLRLPLIFAACIPDELFPRNDGAALRANRHCTGRASNAQLCVCFGRTDDVEVRHEIIEGCQSSSCLWLDYGSIELWAGKLSNRLY